MYHCYFLVKSDDKIVHSATRHVYNNDGDEGDAYKEPTGILVQWIRLPIQCQCSSIVRFRKENIDKTTGTWCMNSCFFFLSPNRHSNEMIIIMNVRLEC